MFSVTHNNIIYTIRIPAYPVNLVVDHFVIMRGTGSAISERLFPNNKAEIFFNLGDGVKGQNNLKISAPIIRENIVSGVRQTFFDYFPPSNFFMAGMRFTLFGFNQLFKIPAHHFTDDNFSANDVWGREIQFLQESLHEAKDDKKIFTILNDWAVARLSKCSLQEITIWNKLEKKFHDSQLSVSEILENYMGYSNKHSIQLFKNHAGLRPKDIKKIIRFDQCLMNISRTSINNWAGFACALGYADQSHFIRDFRHFTGYTPLEYLSMKPHEYFFYQNLPEDNPAR